MIGLLIVDGVLWLAESLRWFGKGWSAVAAVGALATVFTLALAWCAVCLLIGRRFQFSMRFLLAAVAVAAVPCCWMTNEMKEAQIQAATVSEIREHFGYVTYDCENHEEIIFKAKHPSSPEWLRNLLGRDFFDEVEYIDFGDPRAGDAAFAHVERLAEVEWLDVSGSKSMFWDHSRTQLTDKGLSHIGRLPKLRYLFLPGSKITDAGLGCLGDVPKLNSLVLSDTNISDSGISYLKRMRRLKELDLAGTKITDAGLSGLAEMHQLQELDLRETRITDRGLSRLETLLQLTLLSLYDTGTTADAIAALQRKLPRCKIVK